MKNIVTRVEPGKIEARSFAIIESEVSEPRVFKGNEWLVVRRMIHTTADLQFLSLERFHSDAVRKGKVIRLKLLFWAGRVWER